MKVGIIGCGGIGYLRAAALKHLPSCKLEVVSDIDKGRARSVTARYGGKIEPDWRSLVHSESLDAVIVSTPPHLHAEMCIEALKSGKHVLCEKPLARTLGECQNIIEVAEQSNRLLATGFNYRFYPSIQMAHKLLDSGIIGDLDHIRSYTGYSATDHNQSWLHDIEIMGGGALQDNGIHLIDLTCHFLGSLDEIKGFATNSVWQFKGCEDNGFGILRSKTGKIAVLQASWTEWRGYRFIIEIYGSLGCIQACCFPMLTKVIWSSEIGGKTKRKTHFFPKTFFMEHLCSYRWVVIQSFILELEAFYRSINGENTVLASGLDGLRAVEVAKAITQNYFNFKA